MIVRELLRRALNGLSAMPSKKKKISYLKSSLSFQNLLTVLPKLVDDNIIELLMCSLGMSVDICVLVARFYPCGLC